MVSTPLIPTAGHVPCLGQRGPFLFQMEAFSFASQEIASASIYSFSSRVLLVLRHQTCFPDTHIPCL